MLKDLFKEVGKVSIIKNESNFTIDAFKFETDEQSEKGILTLILPDSDGSTLRFERKLYVNKNETKASCVVEGFKITFNIKIFNNIAVIEGRILIK